jgi:hypothetical protein
VQGFAVVLVTAPARSVEFLGALREAVRQSTGGVLISLERPARWQGGPVVAVHLRAERDHKQSLGPGVWLGPLREDREQQQLCQWIRQGGPRSGPPPQRLLNRTLPSPRIPLMARHTVN